MLTLLLGALFGAIVLLAPGWTVARAAGVGRLSALALAPAISAVILSAAQVLTSALSLHWMAWGPPVVIGLIAALGFPARVMRRKGWIRIGPTLAGSTRLRADQRAWLLGGAVVAGAVAVAAATAAPKASWPAQAYDVTFHVNAITVMREVGDASPFGGLWPIYQGYRVFYPTLWHAIAVFIPGSAIQATNALLLGCALFVWPALLTGMLAALRRTLGEGWARTTGLTVALASTTAAVPVLMTSLTVWPYVLSVLTLPGILAVLGTALRDILDRTCTPGTSLGALIVIGAGAVLAHGAGAFNVLAISLPFVAAAMHHVLRLGGRGRRIMLRVLPLLAAGALIGGWVMRQQVASVLSYQRPAGGWDGAAETVKRILLDVPQYGVVPPIAWIPAGALFTILVFMGAWQAHHDVSLRPWVALWLMAVMIVLLTSGPAWPGRQIGAPGTSKRRGSCPWRHSPRSSSPRAVSVVCSPLSSSAARCGAEAGLDCEAARSPPPSCSPQWHAGCRCCTAWSPRCGTHAISSMARWPLSTSSSSWRGRGASFPTTRWSWARQPEVPGTCGP